MKTRIPVVLALAAALALAACAPAHTADVPQNEQTAETARGVFYGGSVERHRTRF